VSKPDTPVSVDGAPAPSTRCEFYTLFSGNAWIPQLQRLPVRGIGMIRNWRRETGPASRGNPTRWDVARVRPI